MTDDREFDSASSLPTRSRILPSKRYAEMHRRSLEDPERFWAEEARTAFLIGTHHKRGGSPEGNSMPATSVLTAM